MLNYPYRGSCLISGACCVQEHKAQWGVSLMSLVFLNSISVVLHLRDRGDGIVSDYGPEDPQQSRTVIDGTGQLKSKELRDCGFLWS